MWEAEIIQLRQCAILTWQQQLLTISNVRRLFIVQNVSIIRETHVMDGAYQFYLKANKITMEKNVHLQCTMNIDKSNAGYLFSAIYLSMAWIEVP